MRATEKEQGSPVARTALQTIDTDGGLARQRDRGAAELAVGAHADRLLVACRAQRDIRVEARGRGDQLVVPTAAAAFQRTADVAARFAPASRNRAAAVFDIGG